MWVTVALNTITGALPEDERVDSLINSCLKAFQEDYSRNWNVKTKTYDGIPELLNSLTDRKVKITVLSNKPHKYTKQCIEGFLPDWDFDVIFGQRDDVPRKPDPAGALEIAEKLNLSPSDILYLGDTDVDMEDVYRCWNVSGRSTLGFPIRGGIKGRAGQKH